MVEDTIWAIGFVICLIALLFGGRFFIQFMNNVDCKADAQALKVEYEYIGGWIARDKCVYILPSGKRILSTQYRGME